MKIKKPHCGRCKTTENIRKNGGYYNRHGKKLVYYYCTDCNTQRLRRYRANEQNRLRVNAIARRSKKKSAAKKAVT